MDCGVLTWFTEDRYDELFSDTLTIYGTHYANHGHMRDEARSWAKQYKKQAKRCISDGWNWDTADHKCIQISPEGTETKYVFDRDGGSTTY